MPEAAAMSCAIQMVEQAPGNTKTINEHICIGMKQRVKIRLHSPEFYMHNHKSEAYLPAFYCKGD